jgi:sec-independent protein translocase protein TatA
MGSMSIWHWLVVAVIVLLLFGRGKISELMGDVAGGIKAFKKGMAEDDDATKAEEARKKLEDAAGAAKDAAASAASTTKTN